MLQKFLQSFLQKSSQVPLKKPLPEIIAAPQVDKYIPVAKAMAGSATLLIFLERLEREHFVLL
ncbi:MAG: hypothetical protein C5B45_01405 [Chlamydiae bacterium]|nr:MAG: hypothetical protein C5B45_01405 [Chlamydiota bacterium]